MSWVLIYIATKFLDPIPLISPRIADFPYQFPPKSKNFATRIFSKKSEPEKAGPVPAKAGPRPAKAGPSCWSTFASQLPHPASIHASLHLLRLDLTSLSDRAAPLPDRSSTSSHARSKPLSCPSPQLAPTPPARSRRATPAWQHAFLASSLC
jgi:hypothetical protein